MLVTIFEFYAILSILDNAMFRPMQLKQLQHLTEATALNRK